MTTFLSFLGILFLAMIFKFVYDTFLTNNTEKRWTDYKTSNPVEAATIEKNTFLNLNTDISIKRHGVYCHTISGDNRTTVTEVLAFGHTHATHLRCIGLGSKEMCQKFLNQVKEAEENQDFAWTFSAFEINQGNQIRIPFNDENNELKKLYEGQIINNGLILTVECYEDTPLGYLVVTSRVENKRFTFRQL